MRVKIADQWFEVTPEQPICIEMTQIDKSNISNMEQSATKYAVFDDHDIRSTQQRLDWMRT